MLIILSSCTYIIGSPPYRVLSLQKKMPSYVGLPRTFARASLVSWAFWAGVVTVSTLVCNELDQKERDRCNRFRDKSGMFGGKVKEGDPPSWGRPYKPYL